LGTYSFVNACNSFIMYYVTVKFLIKIDGRKLILFGGLLLFLSVSFIIFHVSYINFILYAVCTSIAYPLVLVPYNSLIYDVIGQSKNVHTHRVEYIVVKEWFLYMGRATSIFVFIVVIILFHPIISIPFFLIFSVSGYIFIYLCTINIKMNKKYK